MSIEQGYAPPPENVGSGFRREQPQAIPGPYMAPEMKQAATNGEIVKQDYIEAGDKQLRIGDPVVVLRSNGNVENDWKLFRFGNKFAVVEKVDLTDGTLLRKTVQVGELADWQSSLQSQGEQSVAIDRGYGGNNGLVDPKTPEGQAEMSQIQEKMAISFGIDPANPNRQALVESKIREMTGV